MTCFPPGENYCTDISDILSTPDPIHHLGDTHLAEVLGPDIPSEAGPGNTRIPALAYIPF